VVISGSDLQGIVLVLVVDGGVDREALVEESGDFFEVVGRDGPEHSEFGGVGEDSGVGTVPGDVVVEEGDGIHEEGVGRIAGEFGEPLVDSEGQPLRDAVLSRRHQNVVIVVV